MVVRAAIGATPVTMQGQVSEPCGGRPVLGKIGAPMITARKLNADTATTVTIYLGVLICLRVFDALSASESMPAASLLSTLLFAMPSSR